MLKTVLSVIDRLEEPVEFVATLRDFIPPQAISDGTPYSVAMHTPAENLALAIFLYHKWSCNNISAISFESGFSDLGRIVN